MPAGPVAADGQREPEGQDARHEAQQCGLSGRDRLSQRVGPVVQPPAGDETAHGGPEDDGEQQEDQDPVTQREEQQRRPRLAQHDRPLRATLRLAST